VTRDGTGPAGSRARTALLMALRLGLGALFVVAGALKWRDPSGFAQEIANYRLLPDLAVSLAIVLPGIEVLAGAALLAGPLPWRRAGAGAIMVITAAFTVAVFSAVVRGLDISCGCFGAGSGRVSWLTVARNLALLASAAGLVWAFRGAAGGQPRVPRSPAI
jgi:putative oxidoreductase